MKSYFQVPTAGKAATARCSNSKQQATAAHNGRGNTPSHPPIVAATAEQQQKATAEQQATTFM